MTDPMQMPMMENNADTTGEVLHKINDGFRILAELHGAITATSQQDSAEALEHVSAATRELAAIQRLYDRRSDR